MATTSDGAAPGQPPPLAPTIVALPSPPVDGAVALPAAPSAPDGNNEGDNDGGGGGNRWGAIGGASLGSFVASAASAARGRKNGEEAGSGIPSPPSSGNGGAFLATLTSNIASSVGSLNQNLSGNVLRNDALSNTFSPLSSMTKSISQSISHGIAGKNTLPDKTTASQVLMFRQLLHTNCRPGLRLSRKYEGTAAQKAVLHMPVRSLASSACFWCRRGHFRAREGDICREIEFQRRRLSNVISDKAVSEEGEGSV